MDKEYECLHEEILNWQDKRFTLVSASIILVTTALGLVSEGKNTWPWEIVSSIILAFLFCVCLLTWYFGTSNARLGAYIEVFYETADQPYYRWHTRNRAFKHEILLYRFLSFNSCLALIYLVLGVSSIVIPSKFQFPTNSNFLYLLLTLFLLFLVTIVLLIGFSYPRKRYVSYWQKVKEREADNKPVIQTDFINTNMASQNASENKISSKSAAISFSAGK